MDRFDQIDFGQARAEWETTTSPVLLRKGFLDPNGIVPTLMSRNIYLVLGSKGTGKSAIAEKIHSESTARTRTMTTIIPLSDFPYASFSNPSRIQKLVLDFQEYVKVAKIIIVVGVRPYPVDIHVWEPISHSNADLFLVANRRQCDEWIAKYRPQNSHHIGETFQSSWGQICQLIADRL